MRGSFTLEHQGNAHSQGLHEMSLALATFLASVVMVTTAGKCTSNPLKIVGRGRRREIADSGRTAEGSLYSRLLVTLIGWPRLHLRHKAWMHL